MWDWKKTVVKCGMAMWRWSVLCIIRGVRMEQKVNVGKLCFNLHENVGVFIRGFLILLKEIVVQYITVNLHTKQLVNILSIGIKRESEGDTEIKEE